MWLDAVQMWKKACLQYASLLGLFFLTGSAVLAADRGNVPGGLEVYSALNFIENEGEFSGIQVTLVPYVEGHAMKQKVLWRSAGPFLDLPLLLDVVAVDKNLRVVVPDGDGFSGTWNLSLRGNAMIANGPNGQVFTLKKLTVK